MSGGNRERRRPVERRLAGHHLVQAAAQRVQVRAVVAAAGLELLGGQVAGVGQVGIGRAQREVGDLDAAVGGDEEVLRLEVPVEDAGGVGGTESGAGADPDPDGQVGLERALVEQLTDAAPLHQLGDDEASVLVEVVDGGRVGVPDLGCVPGQDGQARLERRVGGQVGWTTLTATGWSSTRSWPSQTWPTGPAPSFRRSW